MKRKIVIWCLCMLLTVLLCGCGAKTDNTAQSEGSETTTLDLSEYAEDIPYTSSEDETNRIGQYEATDGSISLTIFDINDGEVFFEIGLPDEPYGSTATSLYWTLSGTAQLESNCAEFAIVDKSGTNAGTNSGTISFNDGTIVIDFQTAQKNFEKYTGSYTVERVGDVNTSVTYNDGRLGLNNHTIFSEFVENSFSSAQTAWQYLGQTYGEFGQLTSVMNYYCNDLYRLSIDDDVRYYAVGLSDLMTESEYGVCEIVNGALTQFIYTVSMEQVEYGIVGDGNYVDYGNNSGYTSNPQGQDTSNTGYPNTPDVEMCIGCGIYPQSSIACFYCDSCRCIEQNCISSKEQGSLYCGDHNCAEGACKEGRCEDSSYCYSHKCIVSGCNSERFGSSEYCGYHKN